MKHRGDGEPPSLSLFFLCFPLNLLHFLLLSSPAQLPLCIACCTGNAQRAAMPGKSLSRRSV